MGAGVILNREEFDRKVRTLTEVSPPFGWEDATAIYAHDAALRRQVEELTRERDELRQQVDGVLSIVRHYAQDDGSDPVVGKVRRVMDCYQQALVALSVGAAALAERDALRARLEGAEAALEFIRCESAETRAVAAADDYFAEFRAGANRVLAETAQGANAEPTAPSGGAPRMPAPPAPTPPDDDPLHDRVRRLESRSYAANRRLDALEAAAKPAPTPPAAEASDVEALARWLHDTYEDCASIMGWRTQESCRVAFDALPLKNRATMRALAAEILRREAALRERAEKAEAELERMRDPERERLIADVCEAHEKAGWRLNQDCTRLVRYERARRAKEKP